MKTIITTMLRSGRQLAARLLEAFHAEDIDARTWPEFRHMSDAEWNEYLHSLWVVWVENESDAGFDDYAVDFRRNFLLAHTPDRPSFRFNSRRAMDAFLDAHGPREEEGTGLQADTEKHIYTYQREPDAPKYSLEQKRAWVVYEYGDFIFIKMPTDADFLRREGIDMQHCLSVAHKDYCRRMLAGELDEYSMVDTRDGLPKVDIEVALTRGSYSHINIEKPTVTQIRGMRNEMPPKDEYLEPIMAFFKEYGKDWAISGHSVKNFDGQVDGDRVLKRWQQLQGERANEQA
jgi:hypothetical protein